ncbi:DUF732 domain-containing protein [Terrabacter sp. MAHUQ-38]|jgi:hypothetical protein|uniref:DUF732 domain-containing protein n=1 Tax=unclassified Terrabacter TaxID=2630222 RepID=UPI00165DF409|nr:DUF732 domain-containing protein [Terrabacter sp. MAHUQ-38]MBC9820891.1 DUF732 domain-containing protein [Terrabacter sp. MAHUQ-38]
MQPISYAARRARRRPLAVAAAALLVAMSLAGCGGADPTLADLPSDVASARPTISAEEAQFVLAAEKLGAKVTGATVADDIETGTTTCWALENGGVQLRQIAVDDAERPLGNTGDALRTKQLMAAGVQAFCPDHDDQVGQLDLP